MNIKLVKFLVDCGVRLNINSYKVHLATGYPNHPLDEFYAGKFKEWQEYQTRRNFPCEMVISLIEWQKYKWVFAGVYKILGSEKISEKHISYQTELIGNQEGLIGRIIVDHRRTGRASYLYGTADGGEFFISEIREKKLSIEEFPGYNAVHINHNKLKILIDQSIQSWYGALSNVKGIYLISDIATGKLYVGSATGDGGIWQRWAGYAANGHGGNVELKDMLKNMELNHQQHFNYSVLEIADSHATDYYILERESYWKNVLMTRSYGYNRN